MKILIDGQAAQGLSSRRGLGVYTKNLIASLAFTKDADVEIYVLLNAKLSRLGDSLEAHLLENVGVSGVIWWPGGIDSNPFSKKSLDEAEYFNSLIQNWFIASFKVDCVIYPGFMENGLEETSIGRIGKWFNSIVVHHDFIQVDEDLRSLSKSNFLRFKNLLERSASASGFIFISEFTREKSRDYLPQNIPSIVAYPPMTKVQGFKSKRVNRAPVDEFSLLFLGGTDGRKNLFFLLRSLCSLRLSRSYSLALDIVGPYSRAKFLLFSIYTKMSRLKRYDIRFHGYVSADKLDKLYEKSDLLVVPSTSEGFGLPVFEALSRGATVLVARNSALAEVAGSEELTFELKTEHLAETLKKYFSERTYREMLSTLSRKRFHELENQISRSGADILDFARGLIKRTETISVVDRSSLDDLLLQSLDSYRPKRRSMALKTKILELIYKCSFVLDSYENRSWGKR